uniref:FBD domain-containing protein n=1 Tax=Aegilops tauschii TaxID=37682 RepID=M8AZ24_AEGTA
MELGWRRPWPWRKDGGNPCPWTRRAESLPPGHGEQLVAARALGWQMVLRAALLPAVGPGLRAAGGGAWALVRRRTKDKRKKRELTCGSHMWRELWRRTTSLLINAYHCQRLQQLAKLFIQLRGNSSLAKCQISTCPDNFPDHNDSDDSLDHNDSDDSPDHVDSLDMFSTESLKLLLALVQELLLKSKDYEDDPLALDMPLISHQLNILHLKRVTCSALNFSLAVESLKRLCITDICLLPEDFHIRIFAPDLISLQIDDFDGATPFLEDMPFLVTANIGLGVQCHDYCEQNLRDCDDHSCSCHIYPVEGGLLLNGLSNSVSLELIAEPTMLLQYLYRWDLEWCPMFGKLKTLLLNEWFTAIDLVCIFRHSPVLEMLTLHLGNTKNLIEATAAPETIEQSFVCGHLEVVKIVCRKVDVGIRKISSILSTFGVDYKKICIEENSFCSNLYGTPYKPICIQYQLWHYPLVMNVQHAGGVENCC